MRSLAFLLALALVGFSGCTDPEAPVDPVQGTDGGNGTAEPTPPASEGAAEGNGTQEPLNAAPVANLTADVINGTAPLHVTLTLSASDADNDALTWTLTVNGTHVANGTDLPASFNHTFEAGTWNVTAAVSDGQATVQVGLAITVVAGANGPIQTFSGTWTLGDPSICAAFYSNPYHAANAASHGINHFIADVDADTIGREFTATFSDMKADVQGVYVHFSSPSTINIKAFGGADVVTGIVPDGAQKVTFSTCGASGATVAYSA